MTAGAIPVLAAGARTAVGRLCGGLSQLSAVDLGALAARAAIERSGGLTPDYIVMGNVLQAANGQNPARQAAVLAGVDRNVPGITVNDVCLASASSVAMAASMIRTGEMGAVLVGGFDSMSRAPHALRVRSFSQADESPLVDVMVHDGLWCSIEVSGMGEISDRENARLKISREDQDAVALASHKRAMAAEAAGILADEIVTSDPLPTSDEGVRRSTSLEALAALRPAFSAAGTITAGNASQLSDAGAAGLMTSLEKAHAHGIAPLCEIVDRAVVAGKDSSLHLKPAHAARAVLDRHGLSPQDIDLWEINEAFAGVVVASIDDLGIDLDRVNVNGGAIAIGHPLGASGFRILLTLANELRRRRGEFGIAAICGGGGQGSALLIRNL